MMLIHEGMNDMSDKIISIIIKKNGDIQINICQSNNNENENKKESEIPINFCQYTNNENENRKESEKPSTEIIGDIKQELNWDNSLIQKST